MLLLAKRKYQWLYFLGRLLSFSLMGLVSAEMGLFFFLALNHYHLSAFLSLILGVAIIVIGCCLLFRLHYPGARWLAKQTSPLSARLGQLMANDSPYATFLFGLATILLPCGQTLVVASACALRASPLEGLLMVAFLLFLLHLPSLLSCIPFLFSKEPNVSTILLWEQRLSSSVV